jgi:hypothetical protein
MSNYVLPRADGATHLKIVVVSLIAGLLVIGVGISARPPASDGLLRIEDNGVALKAVKPASWSSRASATVR